MICKIVVVNYRKERCFVIVVINLDICIDVGIAIFLVGESGLELRSRVRLLTQAVALIFSGSNPPQTIL